RARSSRRGSFRAAGPRGPRPDDVRPDKRVREPAVFRRDRPDQVRASDAKRSPPDARLRAVVRQDFQRDEIVKKAPSSNIQAPEKLQTSSSKTRSPAFWFLELGVSLELGAWCLELVQ